MSASNVSLSFADVRYTVPTPRGPRTLLHGVSGRVVPGQCCAILGSSGSGKTTLLDILAGVIPATTKDLSGAVKFNGQRVDDATRTLLCSYVMQDDRLLPNLTVRDTFWYAAQLRLSDKMTSAQKDERVNEVINELGLRKVAHSRIGGTFTRGVSGGERRRISIGVQLLSNPSVLFLDEPTTGLDAFTSNNVVNTLVNLASKQSKTIVFTIHQPRSDIFGLLDQVMLLSEGQCCYFGSASQLIPHFTALDYPCDIHANPLDHYIDIISIDTRTEKREADSTARLTALCAAYKLSEASKSVQDGLSVETEQPIVMDTASSKRQGGGIFSFFFVLYVLLSRQWTDLRRDYLALSARLGQLGLFSMLLFLFLTVLDNNQASVQNRTGLLYQTVMCAPVLGLLNAVSLFPVHRDLFYRERQEGLYSSFTFLLSYLLHHLPASIFATCCFSTVVYWAIGLYPAIDRFFVFWGVVLLLHIWGEIFTNAFLCFFYKTNTANSAAALIFSISALLATGFVRTFRSMPLFLQDISYATIHKYTSEILVVNEYTGLELVCDPGEICFYPSGAVYLFIQYPDAAENNLLNWLMTGAFVVVTFLVCWLLLYFNRQRLR